MMNNMCLSDRDIEIMTCKLKLVNTRDILILTVYRPPDGDVKEFCQKFESILLEARMRLNVEIIAGWGV